MVKNIELMGSRLSLLHQRALLLPDYETLVVADWHLGKAAHFRKAGIFMPMPSPDKDMQRLQSVLDTFQIRTIVFLGDLFHSDLNSEWSTFERFRAANPSMQFVLTIGNHDLLSDDLLDHAGVEVVRSYAIAPHIHCTHHPVRYPTAGVLHIAGHVHPGCLIPAKGRQAFRFPCFYYHAQTFLLPAFGSLTGLYTIPPLGNDRIYPIVGDRVWEWKKV